MSPNTAIAVVGMSCNFPGAGDLRTFWENILARRQQFRLMPSCRLPVGDYYDADPAAPEKTYGRRAAVIEGFNFDWKKRFIPKLTVETADIAHWLSLETAIAALEDAGLGRENTPTEKSGVILGNTLTGEQTRATAMRQRWPFVRKALRAAARSRGLGETETEELALCMQDYFQSVFAPTTEDSLSGGLSNTIAGRICNYLDFHGGGYTVDGACSSSLIAVATAATALANGDMDFVLAGGVDVSLDTFELIGFAKIGALTHGDMAVYDKRGDGFIPGEGCGFVALKRLEDARAAGDRVYAVIRGWGISSDGKGGLTAPSRDGQAMALRRAYERAGYDARDVDFFEGHGTGTTVGDRVEIEGIGLAVGATHRGGLRTQGLTSVKSVIGHTKAAAGVAGFIKAALAVHHRVLPPTAGCRDPNAAFEESAPTLYPLLQGEIRPREASLRAGVSAMGFGGINCHVTLESGDRPAAPAGALDPRAMMAHAQDAEIFVFSAKSVEALRDRAIGAREKAYGLSVAEMADFAASLAHDAGAGAFRAALVARNPDELDQGLARLESLLAEGCESHSDSSLVLARADRKKRLAFVFPGQGSQQPGMARALVERHAFAREIFAQAQGWIAETGGEAIANKIFPPLDRAGDAARKVFVRDLASTQIAQPAICLASLLWLAFLHRLGLKPDVVAGHSLGELTAFHAAGAFDAETLIKLAALRGRAMSARPEAAGAMASLACDADMARALIKDIPEVVTANCNSPRQTVISGAAPALAVAIEMAERARIAARMLPVSNAFHSPFVAGAAALLSAQADVPEKPQRLDAVLLLGIDGTPVGPNCGLRGHFSSQVTAPVDFLAVAKNIAPRAELIVEVGPGQVLTGLLRESLPDALCMPVASRPDSWRDLLLTLAHAFCGGHEVKWPELFAERLIRPFTAATEKLFIESPCERPFRPSKNWLPMDFGGALAARAGLGQAEWSDYLRRRGNFLAKVIRADFDDAPSVGEQAENAVVEAVPAADAPPAVEQVADARSIEAQLISMVARSTGYPAETITAEMRLLDDLNLDSIKAGELVAAAAKLAGVAGALDASAFANASLRDIASALREATVGRAEAAAPAAGALPARWVRCFKVAHVSQELAQADADWSGARALILHETAEADLARCLVERLRAARASALAQTFEKAREENSMAGAGFTHRLVLLPRRAEQDDLALAVERLALLSATPRQFGEGANSLALAQFGGGLFGAGATSARLESFGAGAFAASLHFERPDLQIRALDFDPDSAPDDIATRILAEIASGGAFVRAGYDLAGERRIPVAGLEEPALWPSRRLTWDESDVILVTGGARGVTAECALAFAQNHRTRMALAGSSALDAEIEAILARYATAGLTARYDRCDVRDAGAVAVLIEKIGEELGPVTGLIHGAGVNKPRRAEQADAALAAAEVAPKLQGALNLLDALDKNPPKLIAGLTSIIGVTGMPGNAFYAFSNEALNIVFKNFALRHPATQAVSVAYSVWADIGMGDRMGSGKALARMGVGAISPAEGVARFLHLTESDPGASEIIVTAQLGGLDSWTRLVPPKPRSARFLENVETFEPGVELRLRPHLSFDCDPYLADHIFKGSALFATVFGLEAMAQAAAWATGRERIGVFAFDNISLERPIVVDSQRGATIEIRALVREREGADAPQRIDLEIGAEQTGFSTPHFSATVILDGAAPVAEAPRFPTERLDIAPSGDLYDWLLFQGPMFQRIEGVHALDSRRALLTSAQEQADYLLGDPYFRDSLLQSAQLTVPQHVCLPLRIERLAGRGAGAPGLRRIDAVFDGFVPGDERQLLARVAAFDQEGATLETILGYRLAVLERRSDHPTPEQIAEPDDFDAKSLRSLVNSAAKGFGLSAPALALAYGRWHGLDRTARREAERPHLIRLLAEAGVSEPITWSDSGPQLPRPADFGLSFSHDSRLCLFVAGPGRQGCDLAPLIRRSASEWRGLLGEAHAAVLDALQAAGDNLDRAGTRFWAALEAARKAFQEAPSLNIAGRDGDAVLFDAHAPGDEKAKILTLPWSGLRGGPRMVAITVAAAERLAAPKDLGFHLDAHGASLSQGPQGQIAYALRFPLSFRETSYASRRLYYSHYFGWMGKLREAACQPAYERLVADFSSGRWGMVTNFTETRILADAGAEDGIEGRIWLAGLSGSRGEKMDLCYDWTILRPDGGRELAARSRMGATWVEILDHGVVTPRPLPDYLRDLMERFSPPSLAPGGWQVGARPDLGATIRQGVAGPAKRLLLRETRRETSLQHSNLVGNIYFANYSIWQGETIDAWIASFAPETLCGTGGAGEFFCAYSRIEHLREAMPFDTIVVQLFLAALREKGAALSFEFFREMPAGERQKLAWGEADLSWTERDGNGHWRAATLPERYTRKIDAHLIEPVSGLHATG